jgi:hypothetical protein
MKIKFKKFEATNTFIKLFGIDRHNPDPNISKLEETSDTYEYYYKRGNTYYFRNKEGNKIAIDYKEPQSDLIKGNSYNLNTINNSNS